MSFGNKFIKSKSRAEEQLEVSTVLKNSSLYAFVDVEVGMKDNKIHDIGALRGDNAIFHSANKKELLDF